MGGSLKGARALKTGAGMAKINNQEVEASNGIDLGFSLAHDPVENSIRPAWLSRGEFIMSVPAVKALGLRSGAAPKEAHAAGIKALREMHEELRGVALNSPLPDAVEENDDVTVEPARQTKRLEHVFAGMTHTELLAEAQIIEEHRERAAVADETGRWHASDELINAVIAAESGGDPNAVSKAGAVGLLQILPSTTRDPGFGVAGLEGSDEEIVAQLKNPEINRRLGSEYLSAMLHRYHGDADLAPVAYNAGPARADTAAKDERPLNRFIELNPKTAQETLPYIKRVLGNV